MCELNKIEINTENNTQAIWEINIEKTKLSLLDILYETKVDDKEDEEWDYILGLA